MPGTLIYIAKYMLSSILVAFTFYALPSFVFTVVKAEKHERISTREDTLTFMTVAMMLLNILILPFGASSLLSVLDKEDHIAFDVT
jgi:hypothetical protein